MDDDFAAAADAILREAVASGPRVPGVVAMATDRRRTIYEGAAGERLLGGPVSMTTDTVFAIFSATKAVTGTAALQLVESGRLDLDAPAKTYAPDIGTLAVLEGFDGRGDPILRAPRRQITTRMLLLHTAGFAYDFCNATYSRLVREKRQPSMAAATKAALMTPLLFDPGERWEYGSGVDWVGQIVEEITGRRLGAVCQDGIFDRLGMDNTAFFPTGSMQDRLASLHQRQADGSLAPIKAKPPRESALHMGGQGLYATVGDYMRFIRMWLNDGAGEGGRVLKAETVRMAAISGLGGKTIGRLPGVMPLVCNDVEFFPGLPKSWALTFMVNDEKAPTGRPAGALGWAGLANLYYWIDRQNGYGGFWATQILPFGDAPSLAGFLRFETALYASLERRAPG